MKVNLIFLLLFLLLTQQLLAQQSKVTTSFESKHGTLITEQLTSKILQENRVNLDPNRKVKVYLPPGYAASGKSYPVVYYCHNIFYNSERLFQDSKLIDLLEQGFANKVVKEFILVAADYSTASTGSLYENSPISGRWLDFTVQELVPYIDSKFRTLRQRESRAVAGDFMGGRGALKLAMSHAEVFSVAYALHPVATGRGYMPWSEVQIDWKKIHNAKSAADIAGDGRAQIFVAVCQSALPNLTRPPFYCDFFVETGNGEQKLNPENVIKAKKEFHLEETLIESAANLRTMRGIAFDWGRFDPNQDHVYSNREFSRRLEDLGIEHEAEEYRGTPFNKTWNDTGRFATRVLPFLARHLVFENN
ncbi:MAG TPA: alpha/beta hydrolase-fold protein [Chryseolinea sp.]|nr:alpha/beta hydrolase-fold protein [Chryseolinea sp.]